ncbi:hypothetical protein [Deinococcus multiflagellatus]|nr:hypothetical protein [Deinococcus multiflagellatus]MBZ9713753.1 hypothetical protein [Deinococcus multiflagellatus]
MTSIPEHLRALLVAALPARTRVLLPEQAQEPLRAAAVDAQGRPSVDAAAARGLGAYLTQYPAGFVQIELPQGITSDGVQAVFWVAVATLAPTAEACGVLGAAVHEALNGTPLEPGPCPEVTPSEPALMQTGAWLRRPTYQVLTIAGSVAAP